MKYAILNEIDRPDRRMVVQIIDGKAYYMSRAEEPGMKAYDGMQPRTNTTSLEDFGFNILEREFQVDFTKTRDSVARYSDGQVREWQGPVEFSLPKVVL